MTQGPMIDQPPAAPTSEPLGTLVAGLIGIPADATCAIDGASETVLADRTIVCVCPISQRAGNAPSPAMAPELPAVGGNSVVSFLREWTRLR